MKESYWQATAGPAGDFPALDHDLETDVLVVGGGITGVTAALELRRMGVRVVLLERRKMSSGDTGRTTAHITMMTDTKLTELAKHFDEEELRLAWEGGQAGMQIIRSHGEKHGIDCDLTDVPGFLELHAGAEEKDFESLREELELARKLGFSVNWLDHGPLGRAAIRFPDQAKFHPLRYLDGLIRQALNTGVEIHENSPVDEIAGDSATCRGFSVSYKFVVIATHVPPSRGSDLGADLFQTKLSAYSTYAIRAESASTQLPEMIWSDTADPFFYLRVKKEKGRDFLILGGCDHKTGAMESTGSAGAALEEKLKEISDDSRITHRWSGQIIEPVDGLPFIGTDGDGRFIATGFSGNGMTYGSLAAQMARDAFAGRENRWRKLFALNRKTPSCIAGYVKENATFPASFVADRLGKPQETSADLPCSCGAVLDFDGGRSAVFRDESGLLHVLDPVCPHLGCIVRWNETEKTWDCPCHGSRFNATGGLIAGPAVRGLSRRDEDQPAVNVG
ncbi:MAG: FAD-dependent oxidoreductase [Verrucomicrobiota bacterium]